jgi:hypothetical protein
VQGCAPRRTREDEDEDEDEELLGETHGLKKLAERKFLRLRRAAHQFAHDRRQQVYFPGIFIYLFLAVSVTLFCRSCDS